VLVDSKDCNEGCQAAMEMMEQSVVVVDVVEVVAMEGYVNLYIYDVSRDSRSTCHNHERPPRLHPSGKIINSETIELPKATIASCNQAYPRYKGTLDYCKSYRYR
jgi:hypothetical protein